jgi:DNA-binding response OmpR family regulator
MSMTSDVPGRTNGAGSQTILVVEDNAELRHFFGWTLRNAGYRVEIAEDAIGAVSTARQVRPDLVVLDLGLPGGSGAAVLERLRNLSATALVDVIVITGAIPDYDRSRELEALGCDTVLLKPVTHEQLLSAISEKTNSARGQGQQSA